MIATHFGGFLPFSVDLTEHIKKGQENILAVWADNSDDAFTLLGSLKKHWISVTLEVFIEMFG